MSKNKYTTNWDLSPMYDALDDPQIESDKKKMVTDYDKFVTKWKNREDYTTDPDILLEALQEYEQLAIDWSSGATAMVYFFLRKYVESENTDIQAAINKYNVFSQEQSNKLTFFTLKISKIPSKDQARFLDYPKLSNYKHLLEKSFASSQYLLSEKEENILSIISKTSSYNWVNMIQKFLAIDTGKATDSNGKDSQEPLSILLENLFSLDKELRDSSAKSINKILRKHLPVAVEEINSVLEYTRQVRKLRGYDRPDKPRHISDDIDTEVVDAMLEAVHKYNYIPNDIYKLRAHILGKDKFEYHERYIPYNIEMPEMKYDEAMDLVHKIFANLDDDLGEIVLKLATEGNIDVFPKKGKSSGAFCYGSIIKNPTYVMLNFTGKISDAMTIAHELGHAVNNELIKRQQTELQYDVSKATAEVASTFFEDFILEELLLSADKDVQKKLTLDKLDDYVGTIFRQVAAYKFEQDLHTDAADKGFLPAEHIGDLFSKRMSEYMGDYIKQSKGSENWWVYWSHFRRPFYVYSYASGLLISKALQSMIKEDKSNMDKVVSFLGVGTSMSPKDTFMEMGVDITDPSFWISGLKEIEKEVNEAKILFGLENQI